MLLHHYHMMANQKQQEIEHNAKVAWMFDVSKEEGIYKKIMKSFAIHSSISSTKSDNCVVC
jgi:hypothetical protein